MEGSARKANRILWPLVLAVVAIGVSASGWLENNTLRLFIHKLGLISLGAVVAHMFRKIFFPYIDLRLLLKEDKCIEMADAIKFAGAAILAGLIYYAVILGLVSGI